MDLPMTRRTDAPCPRRRAAQALLVAAALATAGCAQLRNSPLNPGNWGEGNRTVAGTSEDTAAAPAVQLDPLVPDRPLVQVVDTRPPVARITGLRVLRSGRGLLVEAEGVAAGLGAYNAQLVPDGIAGGTARFTFRAAVPQPALSTPRSETRTVTAAVYLPADMAAGLRLVQVTGAQNSMSTRP